VAGEEQAALVAVAEEQAVLEQMFQVHRLVAVLTQNLYYL
jgi:hypothetical protein